MTTFDPRLLSLEPFAPHPYASLEGVFPPGAVPEAVYRQMLKKYAENSAVEVRRIVYRSEGLRVTGILATPRALTPGAHPIIVYNRGGNREFGKLTLPQIGRTLMPLAQAGALVFASNYRGNDGGEGREEFGGADVADVLTLLDIARAHPAWDGRNAYMIGHSRGGMMTYLAIKAGARLNAAVAIAAPSDLFASGQERPEIEERVHRALIPGEGDARKEAYRARSALYWPQRLTTPLLLLHGDMDDRVDAGHTLRLGAALAHAGMPHETVIYPNGNHALVRHWPQAMERMQGWMDFYGTR